MLLNFSKGLLKKKRELELWLQEDNFFFFFFLIISYCESPKKSLSFLRLEFENVDYQKYGLLDVSRKAFNFGIIA